MAGELASLPILVLLVFYASTTVEAQPTTNPMRDQFVADNSLENVTYTCSVPAGSTVVWEVERSQIRSQQQFNDNDARGISIVPMDTASRSSTISISAMARANDGEILVQCLADQGTSGSVEGEVYRVVTFGPPEVPGNLMLFPALTLEWTRPPNVPTEVPISYTIEINSTDGNGMNTVNITSETAISVQFLENVVAAEGSQCVEFEFFVSGVNDAGSGPRTSILDTVPISPDVTNVNRDLRVVGVDVEPLDVDISFPPVQPCSANFPLTNYTLNINGSVGRVLSPGDVMDGAPLTDIALQGLTLDNSFSLTVTACNEVTCRTSDPRTINTTDVQSVEAVFFENRLFLRCFFAGNSQARGCIIRLTLSSTNETESFEVTRESGFMCATANNQRDAYSTMVVLDLEANGMEGNVSLNINSTLLTSQEEYTRVTGCREAQDNTAAIVGGVLAALAGTLIIAVVVILAVLFFVSYRKKKLEEDVRRGPPPSLSTLQRPRKAPKEKEPLMFECDVAADEECAKKIKDDLLAPAASTPAPQEAVGDEVPLLSMHEPSNKEAWIDPHDDPEEPLTINLRWNTLVNSLIAINSLRTDKKPLIPPNKNLSKVKVQLHMSS